MAQVQGIPYRRHGPSAALREFLDPLDPGGYFDCGRARLHGLDDALLEEARSRGREVGDDAFLLVATDMGLIFCRPSISFAIAARWEELTLIRPRGDDPVVLPVTWPRHGELKFTISKRLAGNIFRRWLQLRMHAARQARRPDPRPLPTPAEPEIELEPAVGLGAEIDIDIDVGSGEEYVQEPNPPVDEPAEASDRADPSGTPAPGPAETSDNFSMFDVAPTTSVDTTLADEDLQRVTVPQDANQPASWVGSAVSVAASFVVISTVVLIAAVSVSVWRGGPGAQAAPAATERAEGPPTTIDHERFRASSDPVGELAPSAAGGASQAVPSSSQQLLAVPPDEGSTATADEALRCSSNYSGCVPDVEGTAGADVDCVGQGDGPFFAEGEVLVLGDDIYGLDSDGDRRACEADQVDSGPATSLGSE